MLHLSQVPDPSANGVQLEVGNAAHKRSIFAGLFGFFQHPTFALHPPCRDHEPLCESTFLHGCVVEPFPQAHPPLYSSLALFDKVQSGETPGSIQRTMERKPMETNAKNEKHGRWSEQSLLLWDEKVRSGPKEDTKKTQLFPTPRRRRFQRFAFVFTTLDPFF